MVYTVVYCITRKVLLLYCFRQQTTRSNCSRAKRCVCVCVCGFPDVFWFCGCNEIKLLQFYCRFSVPTVVRLLKQEIPQWIFCACYAYSSVLGHFCPINQPSGFNGHEQMTREESTNRRHRFVSLFLLTHTHNLLPTNRRVGANPLIRRKAMRPDRR